MPQSHHSHSGQFCAHAVGTLEEVVQAAIDRGFRTFGLSEHCPRYREEDLYPEEIESGLSCSALATTFASYLEEAHRLRDAYAGKIDLLVGLETEHITALDLSGTDAVLARYPGKLDYLVGSVHHVNEIPIDFDEATFKRALASFGAVDADETMGRFLCGYFDAQYTLMEHLKPEVIGHFDLCRLYRPSLRFTDFAGVWAKIERNVRYAVGYGALFELNAAAFRKEWGSAYPGQEVLDLIISLGGKLCLSDDSHGPKAVGLNYDRLYAYLKEADVRELWYLKRTTESVTSGGRNVVACRWEGDWRTDEFWTREGQQ